MKSLDEEITAEIERFDLYFSNAWKKRKNQYSLNGNACGLMKMLECEREILFNDPFAILEKSCESQEFCDRRTEYYLLINEILSESNDNWVSEELDRRELIADQYLHQKSNNDELKKYYTGLVMRLLILKNIVRTIDKKD